MKHLAYILLDFIDKVGQWLGMLALRLLLGWEFLDSGLEKFRGENWFGEVADKFPWPFSLVSPDVNWQMATGFEIVGGIALMIGLGTRFFATALFILTVVAIAVAHWPAEWHSLAELAQGYVISDDGHGNFKLPLIFLAMLIPLILSGPGRLSLDAWVARSYFGRARG
ncbi:MAG: DoxX family protein [Rhodocyclales bacterium]|nr:DoxX family protein [Rhodocyclales bacterium]